MTGTGELQTDLLVGRAATMTPAIARSNNLAAWAHYTAAAGSDLNRACAVDFAQAWARFQNVQAALAELFDAWRSAGIDATVFKGVAVACLAYPHPALRHFNDVDIYVPADRIDAALAALPAGWGFSPTPGCGHAAGYLRPPNAAVAFDLHRSLFPDTRNRQAHFAQVTQRLLQARITVNSGPASFPSLAPADLVLIGMAVNRGWGTDHWNPKTHDYLDLLYLKDHCGLSESAIESRARELDLSRTWRAFSRSCNPYRPHLDTERPRRSRLFRGRNDLMALPEKGALPHTYTRLFRGSAAAHDLIAVAPTLIQVLADVRRAHLPAQAVVPAKWPEFEPGMEPNVTRGLRWAMRILFPVLRRKGIDGNTIRAITEFRLLAALGYKPDWVFGLRRAPGTLPESHAWVEIDGYPVEGSETQGTVQAYAETTRIRTPKSLMTP